MIKFEKQFLDAAQHCKTEKSIKFRKNLQLRKNILFGISIVMILLVFKLVFIDGKAIGDQAFLLCFSLVTLLSSVYLDVLYKILLVKYHDSQKEDSIE